MQGCKRDENENKHIRFERCSAVMLEPVLCGGRSRRDAAAPTPNAKIHESGGV